MYNGLLKVLVAQSCPTLCYPMVCGPTRSSIHGILQGRILANVALPFSGGSSQPRDWTQVSSIAGRFFTVRATREAFHICIYTCKIQLQDVLIRCIHNKQTMNKSVSSPAVNGFQSMYQRIGVGWSRHSTFFLFLHCSLLSCLCCSPEPRSPSSSQGSITPGHFHWWAWNDRVMNVAVTVWDWGNVFSGWPWKPPIDFLGLRSLTDVNQRWPAGLWGWIGPVSHPLDVLGTAWPLKVLLCHWRKEEKNQ